ncbi:type II toxin-antitoxin system RelE/ParE family toxin [Sphaerobacter sp.]|uniref:type II toxin-antitoxin system RelE/ParE family toxin n=1 Tax=Sphaerobacter sp. TaxID=2099654 RepID=UPI001E06E5BA|nr:type II toxin-antitoxin system RelE/ParE family toxin [Sphaerobacter sp.]MBX5443663.1 type II toxin-antitoxin system RelE/ParE family toxin [Sphaerobacter sp.]
MRWEVEYTDEFEAWWQTLSDDEQDAIVAAVEVLEERGPGLGRPLVDSIRTSRHPNMKELRPPAGNIRVLFAFDPRRVAILLIGGDTTNQWQDWYERMVPIADQLYDDHLETLRKEGILP